MSRNETQTCRELIDPALREAGWGWDWQVIIGPGRVNIAEGSMYDDNQRLIVDYMLKLGQLPLVVLEAKGETYPAEDGIQQAARYAKALGLRYSISSNGLDYILTDNQTGDFERLTAPPSPQDILSRLGRNLDWSRWQPAFDAPWYIDQVAPKRVRPYQQMAIFETLCRFGQGDRRVLLLMATGTGKTFTVFQLVWKLTRGNVLDKNRVLFLTDRNSLQDQAYRAFAAFPQSDRVVVNKETVRKGEHRVGKVFFANYQTLDEELDGQKIYQHYEPDFFDLVVVDECHRSAFGDWFGVLNHFAGAFQLGLTATPREIEESNRPLTNEEKRRDTYDYFGEPAYIYSLKQAIEDGFLVPYLLEERLTNLDEFGYTAPDGTEYGTSAFEREVRLPDRTKAIAEDLWEQLCRNGLQNEKTIIFCVDDTHAALMAQEMRRVASDDQYAARITRSERNSHQLERNFGTIGRSKPRVAVTVDLLTTGFDAPDVKNIVFARPLRSAILYKQMKGRGTRLCEDIDKRFFTIWDYVGASQLEDAEFDGHPANKQGISSLTKRSAKTSAAAPSAPTQPKPVGENVTVFISSTERYVCLADGRKIQFDEYCERSKEIIRDISTDTPGELLRLWTDRSSRKEVREELKDRDIHIAAFRHYFELADADDVDILAKVGFDLARVPFRRDRVVRFWQDDEAWLLSQVGQQEQEFKVNFWQACLDHYSLYGVDEIEQGNTYNAPQFTRLFGNFSQLSQKYGGGQVLKADLEQVKQHLYVPMMP